MTVPLLFEVDVPCPDCDGTGDGYQPNHNRWGGCPKCTGRGTVKVLFFTCPTCGGKAWFFPSHGFPVAAKHCPDPQHDLHGPVTLARLEGVVIDQASKEVLFRIEAEWRADE